jgi:hypothetical protein
MLFIQEVNYKQRDIGFRTKMSSFYKNIKKRVLNVAFTMLCILHPLNQKHSGFKNQGYYKPIQKLVFAKC